MKEQEIAAKFCIACAGASRPQTFFEEAKLTNTDDFVKMKHGNDFSTEILPAGQIIYKYNSGSIMYAYSFTELS